MSEPVAVRSPVKTYEWRRAIHDIEMHPTTRAVVATMADFADADGGSIFPGQERLMRILGIGERTLRDHLRVAKQLGVVRRVRRGGSVHGRADEYVLALPRRTGSPLPVQGETHRKRASGTGPTHRQSDDKLTGSPLPVQSQLTGSPLPPTNTYTNTSTTKPDGPTDPKERVHWLGRKAGDLAAAGDKEGHRRVMAEAHALIREHNLKI